MEYVTDLTEKKEIRQLKQEFSRRVIERTGGDGTGRAFV